VNKRYGFWRMVIFVLLFAKHTLSLSHSLSLSLSLFFCVCRKRLQRSARHTNSVLYTLSLFMNSCFSNSTLNIDDSYDACMLHTVYHHACMDAMLKYITYACIYLFIFIYKHYYYNINIWWGEVKNVNLWQTSRTNILVTPFGCLVSPF
jgi:hypothetical protein